MPAFGTVPIWDRDTSVKLRRRCPGSPDLLILDVKPDGAWITHELGQKIRRNG